jgi:hypothetical protein
MTQEDADAGLFDPKTGQEADDRSLNRTPESSCALRPPAHWLKKWPQGEELLNTFIKVRFISKSVAKWQRHFRRNANPARLVSKGDRVLCQPVTQFGKVTKAPTATFLRRGGGPAF